MPFSFPASPAVGATSTQNGREYRYAGNNVWELVAASGGGGGSVTIPASDPNYANTLLLARFDGTAEDSGPLALSPTFSGSAEISTTQRKFGESSAYFPSGNANTTNCVQYGSGSQFDICKADFTVEAWVYATAVNNYSGIISRDNQTDRRNWLLLLSLDGVKPLSFTCFNTSAGAFVSLTDTVAFPLGQWVHVAAVRDSGVFRLYKNGVQVASAAASSGTGTLSTASGPVTIGALNENGNYGFVGYIDEARVLSTCIYKNGTTFTPPRSAVPAYVAPQTLTVTGSGGGSGLQWSAVPASATATGTAGQIAYDGAYFYLAQATNRWVRVRLAAWDQYASSTTLLLPFDASMTDFSSTPKTVTVYGNAKASGAPKYGSNSLSLGDSYSGSTTTTGSYENKTGTGDWLDIADASDFNFGSGDLTVELWYYPIARGRYSKIVGPAGASDDYPFAIYHGLQVNSGNPMAAFGPTASDWFTNASSISFGEVTDNAWVHLAVVRQGDTFRTYKNGVQQNTGTTNSAGQSLGSISTLRIGRGGDFYNKCRMDDFRVTKGVCRYPNGTNFTPPTALPT